MGDMGPCNGNHTNNKSLRYQYITQKIQPPTELKVYLKHLYSSLQKLYKGNGQIKAFDLTISGIMWVELVNGIQGNH